MIITRTPYRISFFGGGSDYPAWYSKHVGMVLGTTIDKYCWLTVKYNPQRFTSPNKYKLSYSVIEDCKELDDIQHPAIRETLRYLGLKEGIELYHTGDLPARSGVGSSSAFVVGLLNATYVEECFNPETIADLATEIEHDKILCSLGGLNQIIWHPSGQRAIRPIELSPERLAEFQSHLMLFYTGPRVTPTSQPRIYDNTKDLQDIAHSVQTGIMILTSNIHITAFGELLDNMWDLKKRLSSGISTDRVDDLYDTARACGAIGGKLLGSGGGGFMLVFCEPGRNQELVMYNLVRKGCQHVPFQFETEGSKVIYAS